METAPTDKARIDWLNTLIRFAQYDENLPFYLARLFSQPDQYNSALGLIRARQSAVPPAPGTALAQEEWEPLYRRTTTTAPLRELFADRRDPLDSAPAEEIVVLAEISDLTTDPVTTFSSRNGTFHQVYEAVRQTPELNTDEQINDWLSKFYMFFDTDKNVTEDLYKLACSDDWFVVLASLKDARNYIPEGNEKARQTFNDLDRKLNTELRSVLLKPNNLYRAPRKLIKLAWENRALFDQASQSIPKSQLAVEKSERRRQVSNVAYGMFAVSLKEQLNLIAADLQLLAVVARHCIKVRRFAKLDGLVSIWPKIATLAMANYPGLLIVERFLTENPPPENSLLDTYDARSLLEMCQKDEALVRFFRLRPLFSELKEDELRGHRPLAAIPPDATQPTVEAATGPSSGTAAPPAPVASITQSRVCELALTYVPGANRSVPGNTYQLSLRVANTEVAKGEVTFFVQKLLSQMLNAVGATTEDTLQSVLKEYFAGHSGDQILFRGGVQLYKTIFAQSGLEKSFAEALQASDPVRLVIATDDEELSYLPWEWLPQPSSTDLLLSNRRFSLVRSQLTRSDAVVPPLRLPLNMMGIFPNQPLGVRDWSDSSVKSLIDVTETGAQFRYVRGADATLDNITQQLKLHLPEVLHFEGFVTFKDQPVESTSPLAVLLSGESDTVEASLPEFVSPLIDADVQLFVVGRNTTNRVFSNAGPPFGKRLTHMSMPAVVVPIRAVDDVTATAFTSEFYRAFLSGSSLEQALFSARRKVANGGGDWSPFALFANPSVLDFFQPLPPAA